LEDIERAIDDGVHVFRSMIRYSDFVPGGGSTEAVKKYLFRFSVLD